MILTVIAAKDAADTYGAAAKPHHTGVLLPGPATEYPNLLIKNAMIGQQSFESMDFENAAEQLRSSVERNGVALITATPGLGKSHTIDRFLSSLDSTKNYAAYICPAFVSAIEFYQMLSTALGLDPSGNRQRLVSRIKSHILTTYRPGAPVGS